MNKIILYVDASFNSNTGEFAWAGIFEINGIRRKIGKGGMSCKNSTIAEAIGIRDAVITVSEQFPNYAIEVRNDCLSVISLLLGESFCSALELGRVINHIKNIQHANLTFVWVRGHEKGWDTKDKTLNKQVDRYANELRKKNAA